MARRPDPPFGFSKAWDTFLMSLIFALILPLVPLGIERWITGALGAGSLVSAAAIYVVAIGVTSRSRGIFALSILGGVFLSAGYGVALSLEPGSRIAQIETASWASIGLVFLLHGLERYQRHVVLLEPFLEF